MDLRHPAIAPLLFQVEHDLGERIDRANEQKAIVGTLMGKLSSFETQVSQEGNFWEAE